jgi:stearoyl-CoA desaturase (delta-9 desaturase)
MLTHRSFRTSKPVEYVFAALGSMAVEGPVINWVADHRKHHAHTDEEGDPHSPHVGAGAGLAGAVRGLLHAHHVTWSINSACHFFGRRRFATDDHSTNVWWLALPSMGESWHHNHHAFPRSAVHGLGRVELDPSSWIIAALERLGLARDVVRIAPERQRAARRERVVNLLVKLRRKRRPPFPAKRCGKARWPRAATSG